MAKKQSKTTSSPNKIIVNRIARLYRFITILAKAPQTRAVIIRRLKQNVRGFYRDLEYLGKIGVIVESNGHKFELKGSAKTAIDKLPFPDPGFTLGEVLQLANGRTKTHQKLKRQVDQIVK